MCVSMCVWQPKPFKSLLTCLNAQVFGAHSLLSANAWVCVCVCVYGCDCLCLYVCVCQHTHFYFALLVGALCHQQQQRREENKLKSIWISFIYLFILFFIFLISRLKIKWNYADCWKKRNKMQNERWKTRKSKKWKSLSANLHVMWSISRLAKTTDLRGTLCCCRFRSLPLPYAACHPPPFLSHEFNALFCGSFCYAN